MLSVYCCSLLLWFLDVVITSMPSFEPLPPRHSLQAGASQYTRVRSSQGGVKLITFLPLYGMVWYCTVSVGSLYYFWRERVIGFLLGDLIKLCVFLLDEDWSWQLCVFLLDEHTGPDSCVCSYLTSTGPDSCVCSYLMSTGPDSCVCSYLMNTGPDSYVYYILALLRHNSSELNIKGCPNARGQ